MRCLLFCSAGRPIAWWYFHRLSPHAIAANLLVSPLVAIGTWVIAVTILAFSSMCHLE